MKRLTHTHTHEYTNLLVGWPRSSSLSLLSLSRLPIRQIDSCANTLASCQWHSLFVTDNNISLISLSLSCWVDLSIHTYHYEASKRQSKFIVKALFFSVATILSNRKVWFALNACDDLDLKLLIETNKPAFWFICLLTMTSSKRVKSILCARFVC
jgi:hypothetical protein